MTLPEAIAALALTGLLVAAGAEPLREGLQGARLSTAGRELAQRMVAARWRAVSEGAAVGLRFEQLDGRWQLITYRDGDGDGIRTADINRGRDPREGRPVDPGEGRPGIRIGIPQGRFPRVPPARGVLQGGGDPIRFGRSDIASFSPLGNASSGTVYLTDGKGGLVAVVLFGPTARVRVRRFDRRTGSWR